VSWFSKQVLHPAINALAGLSHNPTVQSSPSLIAAVAQARDAATQVATSTSGAAHAIAAEALASTDPILSNLGNGLKDLLDAYLTSLGPPGQLSKPVVDQLLVLVGHFAHTQLDALLAQAGWAHADAVIAATKVNTTVIQAMSPPGVTSTVSGSAVPLAGSN
jgi:hypothetical protein